MAFFSIFVSVIFLGRRSPAWIAMLLTWLDVWRLHQPTCWENSPQSQPVLCMGNLWPHPFPYRMTPVKASGPLNESITPPFSTLLPFSYLFFCPSHLLFLFCHSCCIPQEVGCKLLNLSDGCSCLQLILWGTVMSVYKVWQVKHITPIWNDCPSKFSPSEIFF